MDFQAVCDEKNMFKMSSYQFKTISLDMPETFLARIDGKKVQSKEELFSILKEDFKLPDVNNWDAISDWLCDLSWLESDSYVLVIEHFENFLNKDNQAKVMFMTMLAEEILPWWEKDVVLYSVDGKAKDFNVFLLD